MVVHGYNNMNVSTEGVLVDKTYMDARSLIEIIYINSHKFTTKSNLVVMKNGANEI